MNFTYACIVGIGTGIINHNHILLIALEAAETTRLEQEGNQALTKMVILDHQLAGVDKQAGELKTENEQFKPANSLLLKVS